MNRTKPKSLEIDPHFALRLRESRERIGLSQKALADRCGFTHSYISKLENGWEGAESRSVRAVADTLGVSYEWLTKGEETGGAIPREIMNVLEHSILTLIRDLTGDQRVLLHKILETVVKAAQEEKLNQQQEQELLRSPTARLPLFPRQ